MTDENVDVEPCYAMPGGTAQRLREPRPRRSPSRWRRPAVCCGPENVLRRGVRRGRYVLCRLRPGQFGVYDDGGGSSLERPALCLLVGSVWQAVHLARTLDRLETT